ncbi:hypothetical protein [Streptomyces griseoluteus]
MEQRVEWHRQARVQREAEAALAALMTDPDLQRVQELIDREEEHLGTEL